MGNFLAYVGVDGADDYYGFGKCTAPRGMEAPTACKGHEGNWTFLHFNATQKGVGSPVVTRIYSEPFIKGFGDRTAGLGCSGAVDILGGRLTMFTALGQTIPPETVLSTFSLPSGELLSSVDLGHLLPTFARYMPSSASLLSSVVVQSANDERYLI